MYKTMPHRWFPNEDITIWHDGHIGLKVTPDNVTCFLDGDDMAAFEHPWHDNIFEEAAAVISTGRANAGQVYRQLGAYVREGYIGKQGLYATGVLVRRHNDAVAAFNEAWWGEMLFTLRDQLSFNYLLWKTGTECGIIPANLWPGLAPDMFWRTEHREKMFHAKQGDGL